MASLSLADELDDAIQALIALPNSQPAEDADPSIRELVKVAAELRLLPNSAFRAQLKEDLLDEAFIRSGS